VTLTNRSVTGSGDFLVEKSTRRPEVFDGTAPGGLDIDGDGRNDFALQPGQAERWYRFTTLGDGRGGDQITVTPASEGPATALLRGVDARLDPDEGGFLIERGPTLSIGAE